MMNVDHYNEFENLRSSVLLLTKVKLIATVVIVMGLLQIIVASLCLIISLTLKHCIAI